MTEQHGTATQYRRGCRCGPCRYGQADARRRSRPHGDPEVVRAHVRMLSAAGIGYRRTAELAGVTMRTVFRIVYNGTRPTAETVDKILAVQPTAPPAQRWIPALGTRRRLQALRAIGWSNLHLSKRLNMSELSASQLAMGRRDSVMRATARAIAAMYADLSERQAPMSAGEARNRTFAQRRSWFPPIAWEPELLDDPDALPCLLPPVEPVDRELELHVQHLVAGHPVVPTSEAVKEIIRRMPGATGAEMARAAQTTTDRVFNLRSAMRRTAC